MGYNAHFFYEIIVDERLKEELCHRAKLNENGTLARYHFSVKYNQNGKKYQFKDVYDLNLFFNLMQDPSKRKEIFTNYPMLANIYSADGRIDSFKILCCKNFSQNSMSNIGSGYVGFLLSTISDENGKKLLSNIIKKLDDLKPGDERIAIFFDNILSTVLINRKAFIIILDMVLMKKRYIYKNEIG